MHEIKLNLNYAYNWYSKNNIYVKGYIFDKNNNLLIEEKLISYFENITNENEFKDKLIDANGIFSVIIEDGDDLYIGVDRLRTFPVFYIQHNNTLYISDDTYYLKNKFNYKIDEFSSKEFLFTGYTTGKNTLIQNIYQVQAGEYLAFKDNKLKTKFYSDYIVNKADIDNSDLTVLQDKFLNILDNVADRLIRFADGRQIVVPLSGGYDSRLIACLLKKKNYQNVFCFTYGAKDSLEVSISRQVSERLGFDWFSVEYNEETIKDNFYKTVDFQKLCKYASNYSSVFHIQDYFAIKDLKEKDLIEQNAIIAPGHSGDFLAGSHIGDLEADSSIDKIINQILEKDYNLNNGSKHNFIDKITNSLQKEGVSYSKFDNWVLKERLAKFIVNSNRTYEYFGHQHAMPFWDTELVEFFRVLPLRHKENRDFYNNVLFHIFQDFNVPFRREIKKQSKVEMNIKSILKKITPSIILKNIKKKRYNDFNNFNLITKIFGKKLNKKFQPNQLNAAFSLWYLKQIKNLDILDKR